MSLSDQDNTWREMKLQREYKRVTRNNHDQADLVSSTYR